VLRQPLNLTPPVIVEWDIKLSLYQSCVITFISSINKVGEGVTNQYDRVLVGRVAFSVFISSSNIMREVKCRCSESVEHICCQGILCFRPRRRFSVKNVRGVFQPSSSFHPTPRRELTTFVLSLSSSNRTRRGKCKKYI
jgi:hypothetical protein